MIEVLLWTTISIPLVASLGLTLAPLARERAVARVALGSTALSALASVVAITAWLAQRGVSIRTAPHVPFAHGSYHFTLALVLDAASAVFLALVQFITGMVVRFSRVLPAPRARVSPLLRDRAAVPWCDVPARARRQPRSDVRRLGARRHFIVLADRVYRERQSAVRNALKTYSVYRVADIGMLLAACLEGSGERSGD